MGGQPGSHWHQNCHRNPRNNPGRDLSPEYDDRRVKYRDYSMSPEYGRGPPRYNNYEEEPPDTWIVNDGKVYDDEDAFFDDPCYDDIPPPRADDLARDPRRYRMNDYDHDRYEDERMNYRHDNYRPRSQSRSRSRSREGYRSRFHNRRNPRKQIQSIQMEEKKLPPVTHTSNLEKVTDLQSHTADRIQRHRQNLVESKLEMLKKEVAKLEKLKRKRSRSREAQNFLDTIRAGGEQRRKRRRSQSRSRSRSRRKRHRRKRRRKERPPSSVSSSRSPSRSRQQKGPKKLVDLKVELNLPDPDQPTPAPMIIRAPEPPPSIAPLTFQKAATSSTQSYSLPPLAQRKSKPPPLILTAQQPPAPVKFPPPPRKPTGM